MRERKSILLFMAALVAVITGGLFVLTPAQAQSHNPGYTFSCSADDIGATLTLVTGCAAPEPGLRRYITDIVAQSTTTTGGTWILRYGTGSNCGTGTTSLLPSAATVARLSAPANTAAALQLHFVSPLIVPPGKDLCLLGVGTNTTTMQVTGYLAP